MRIGLLGTGMVGRSLSTKLVSLGHSVMMGSRTADNDKAVEWASRMGPIASSGTFEQAASQADLIINATSGTVSIEALQAAGSANLSGKTLIDVSNPLTFESGTPSLTVCNTDSLGEQIQREFPDAKVVKTLNTLNYALMVDPSSLKGNHNVYVNGNDAAAKEQTRLLLQEIGWSPESIIDLGDITASRGAEAAILLWVNVMNAFGSANFNFKIVRPSWDDIPPFRPSRSSP